MHLLRWIATGAAALALFAFASLALAASGPVDASGLSPFAACTVGGPGTTLTVERTSSVWVSMMATSLNPLISAAREPSRE